MKIIKSLLLVGVLSVFFSGCANNYMTKVPSNKIQKASEDKATIVFMRSSFVSSAITVELFEVNDGKLSFVGFLPNGSKIAHKTTSGKKVYMAYGTAADFMIANVDSGKTYYSIVRPNWGTGGFAPTPVRIDGSTNYNTSVPAFQKWLYNTTLLSAKPNIKEWFIEKKPMYEKIYADYWRRFQQKSLYEKNQRTIFPSDGIK